MHSLSYLKSIDTRIGPRMKGGKGVFMKRVFFLFLFILICCSAAAGAAIKFMVIHKQHVPNISNDAVVQLVQGALCLDKTTVPYYRLTVNVFAGAGGEIEYCVVYLFRTDTYTAECCRLDVSGDRVIKITMDYDEPSNPSQEELCGTCPDPTVEALFSYIADGAFPGAFLYGNQAYSDAVAAGVKAVILHGLQETKQAVLNYLACPKLATWGRIGHGSKTNINLSDFSGSISSDEITKMADKIKGRVFIFNSCWCHNDPFEPAMRNAGVLFFAGGDVPLSGGTTGKEIVYANFYKKAIAGKKELETAMKEAVIEGNYPNAWGYSGANPGPYYLKFGVTGINDMNTVMRPTIKILVNTNAVAFNPENGNNSFSKISIFSPNGRLMMTNTLSHGSFIWDLLGNAGSSTGKGTYLVVIGDGKSSLVKTFSIVK